MKILSKKSYLLPIIHPQTPIEALDARLKELGEKPINRQEKEIIDDVFCVIKDHEKTWPKEGLLETKKALASALLSDLPNSSRLIKVVYEYLEK